MFFTPDRIIGLTAFVVVVLAAGGGLKWLDARIGTPIGDEADPADTTAPQPAASRSSQPKATGRRKKARR